jgi:AcrR family transcriptional regulator
MPDGVKPTRRYDSTRRLEQASATRRDILDAAKRLFERQGYAATSVAAIAAEANCARKTVYLAFESKPGVVRALWHLLLRGDEEPVPIGERAWYREVIAEPDPRRKLQLGARQSRIVKERAGKLMEILRDAASTEPELQELWDRIQTDFHDNQRVVVESLHRAGTLRSGLDVAQASDIMWTLNHPSVYSLLVRERGWTPERYEAWLADAFCTQLLEP